MDDNKILAVVDLYRRYFQKQGIAAVDFPHGKKPKSRHEILGHCLGMLDKMESFIKQDRREKTFRWLGFIQGCLWTLRCYCLRDLANHNRPEILATLCYPIKDGKILLGLKKRRIGLGCWNGFGGSVEEGENIEEAAARELKEEIGLIALPGSLEKAAVIDFYNQQKDGSFLVYRVHAYLVRQWTGEPKAGKEMAEPTWFGIDRLPFDSMMPADKEWLPPVLNGEKLIGRIEYGSAQKFLLREAELQKIFFFAEEQGQTE